MCACVRVCVCVCAHVISKHFLMSMFMYVHTYNICTYVCVISVCAHVVVSEYVCMHIRMYEHEDLLCHAS